MHVSVPEASARNRRAVPTAAVPARGLSARRSADLALSGASIVLIGALDVWKGAGYDVSLIYAFPLAWATWRVSRGAGAVAAGLGAVTDTLADMRIGRLRATPWEILWNLSLQFTFLMLAAWAVDRIRRSLSTEASLYSSLRDVHGRLEQEVQRVADVQQALLPRVLPRIPGYEVAVHYGMSVRAGGDYYDVLGPSSDGRIGFLVADATGHGPAAAVVMAMARVVVHAAMDAQAEPARLLAEANEALRDSISPPNFLTACYAVLRPADGAVEFALAGHPLPIHGRARAREAVEVGTPEGPPLGLLPSVSYLTQRLRLEPGDLLVLFTDGLPEARHAAGDLLGDERVWAAVAASTHLPAKAVVARLVAEIDRHLDGRAAEDDVTIIVVRREEAASGDASAPRASPQAP